jgi:hypothetical protein
MFEGRDARMTRQSEADDRGDVAADGVAAHGIHRCRQDVPSGDKADSEHPCSIEPMLTPRTTPPRPKDAAPVWLRTDLARLEAAFPAFSFAICRGRRGPRFEAWRDTTLNGLYAIITDDPCELWRELDKAPS